MSTQPVKKALIWLLYLLILLALTGCASKSSRFGIVFTNGSADIYRIPDNTQSKIEQLTFTPTTDEYPLLISKNGDKIVFEVGLTGKEPSESEIVERQQHVYILDTSSNKMIDITNILVQYAMVPHNFSMDWSLDQKQFVILADEVVDSEIRNFLEFVDFDGENKKKTLIPITGTIPSVVHSIKWSPDGRKFVLTRGVIGFEQQRENPGNAILVYDLKSGGIIQLTDYKDHCFPLEWSPNSQQIVVTCSYIPSNSAEGVSGPEIVRIFDIENPNQPYKHTGFSPCYDPSWSPDGKQIVFVCDKGKNVAGLFIVNSDGNGIHEVKLEDLENFSVLKEPTWSPDGTQIVYVAGSDYEHENIYLVNLDGSNNRVLTHQDASYQDLSTYPIP